MNLLVYWAAVGKRCVCVFFLMFLLFHIYSVSSRDIQNIQPTQKPPSDRASQQAFSTGCSLRYRSLTFYCLTQRVSKSFRHTVHNVVLACSTVCGVEKRIPSPISVQCVIAFLISQM